MLKKLIYGCIIAFGGICLYLAVWTLSDCRIQEYDWQVIGDTLRNVGTVLAVGAASTAAYISHSTNKTRALEDSRKNFKDSIQWAVQNIDNANQFKVRTASSILANFALNGSDPEKPAFDPLLNEADQKLAMDLMEDYYEALETNKKLADEYFIILDQKLEEYAHLTRNLKHSDPHFRAKITSKISEATAFTRFSVYDEVTEMVENEIERVKQLHSWRAPRTDHSWKPRRKKTNTHAVRKEASHDTP